MPGLSWVLVGRRKPSSALPGAGLPPLAGFTSGAHECGIYGLPSVPAAGFIEGQALLPSPCHDFRVPRQVLGSAQRLDSVDSPAVGVRHIQRARHGVHCQVVLVSWVVALVGEAQREMGRELSSRPTASKR